MHRMRDRPILRGYLMHQQLPDQHHTLIEHPVLREQQAQDVHLVVVVVLAEAEEVFMVDLVVVTDLAEVDSMVADIIARTIYNDIKKYDMSIY